MKGLFSIHNIAVEDPSTGRRMSADQYDFPSPAWQELIPLGGSEIDSLEISGGHASGTATFFDTNQLRDAWSGRAAVPTPIAGTFEIDCGF